MKNKPILSILISLFVFGLGINYLILPVIAQPYYDAYFTSIRVTHGDSYIELISGGTAKVTDGQKVWVNVTFYNDNCGWPWGYLYTKIYIDDTLRGTSDERIVWLGTSDGDDRQYTVYGPATFHFKVEVWWESAGTHYLEDVNEFDLKVVKLSVYNWSPSSLDVEKGKTTASTWSITFDNGGNDMMYSTSISVTDSAGLQISPMSQDLGDITAGGTKSTTFSVVSPTTLLIDTYTVTFRIDYDDFRGISHSETKTALVAVTKLSTTLTINVPSEGTKGEQATFTAILKDGNGDPIADETVRFYIYEEETWVEIDSATTGSNGVATITYTPTATGIFQIKASYGGSQNYIESDSTESTIDVSAPPIIPSEPMDYTLFIIAVIIVVGIIAIVSVLALRRRKEAPLPSPKEPTP